MFILFSYYFLSFPAFLFCLLFFFQVKVGTEYSSLFKCIGQYQNNLQHAGNNALPANNFCTMNKKNLQNMESFDLQNIYYGSHVCEDSINEKSAINRIPIILRRTYRNIKANHQHRNQHQ